MWVFYHVKHILTLQDANLIRMLRIYVCTVCVYDPHCLKVHIDKLVKPLLFWLDIVGCNPRNQSNYAILRWLFMTLYTMVFMGFITGHTISTLRNGITFQSVEDAMNFSLFIQVSHP